MFAKQDSRFWTAPDLNQYLSFNMMSESDEQRNAVNQVFFRGGDLLQNNGWLMGFKMRAFKAGLEVRQGDGENKNTRCRDSLEH